MFKKYIKKLIREVNNEATNRPFPESYVMDRVIEINDKIFALEKHFKINIHLNYNNDKYKVSPDNLVSSGTMGCEIGKN